MSEAACYEWFDPFAARADAEQLQQELHRAISHNADAHQRGVAYGVDPVARPEFNAHLKVMLRDLAKSHVGEVLDQVTRNSELNVSYRGGRERGEVVGTVTIETRMIRPFVYTVALTHGPADSRR